MAAECLMTGEPEVVKARLRAIAPAPYWRKVFLFAASKCCADARSRHLQDGIRLLCDDLNNSNDSLLAATKAGAELALDVLQSGAVAENPNHARHLARIALTLLAQPYLTDESKGGASADQRLALVYRDPLAAVYREELEQRVGQANVDRTLGAWPLLVRLLDRGVDWAVHLSEQSFPVDHQAQLKIVQLLLFRVLSEFSSTWLRRKLEDLLPEVSPPKIWPDLFSFWHLRIPPEASDLATALGNLMRRQHMLDIPLVCPEAKGRLEVRIVPIVLLERDDSEAYAAVARMPRRHPGWLPLILTYNFLGAPNRQTLSKVLKECANGGWEPSYKFFLSLLPWPLAACLDAVRSAQELQVLAAQVEQVHWVIQPNGKPQKNAGSPKG
jgi:hypothetical protein